MEKIKELAIRIGAIDVSVLGDSDLLSLIVSISSLGVSLLSFLVSAIVLIYAGRQYFQKRGSEFHGIYSYSYGGSGRQAYVSEVIIENMKDKSAAISKIYLRINRNIYLELIDYHGSPKIIGPFETVQVKLQEGVSGYISSTFKVNIHDLLLDRKIPKVLMVVTPKGIVKVKKYKRIWNVYFESLRNCFIVPILPVRKFYGDKEYSDSLQFAVKYKDSNGGVVERLFYRDGIYTVNGFQIKTNDYKSSEDLYNHIFALMGNPDGLAVDKVGYTYEDFDSYEETEIFHGGLFMTYVFGKVYTKLGRLVVSLKRIMEKIEKKL